MWRSKQIIKVNFHYQKLTLIRNTKFNNHLSLDADVMLQGCQLHLEYFVIPILQCIGFILNIGSRTLTNL